MSGDGDGSPDVAGWTCPLPLRDHPTVVAGHGGGGRLTADLVRHLFLPAFAPVAGEADRGVGDRGDERGHDGDEGAVLARLADAAVLPAPDGRLAFTTDAYVVRPRVFPGGTLGDLAVNGTVNDLAMVGAVPRHLSAGFVLEEGLALAELDAVARAMGAAARRAGVELVAGDTKVVGAGQADGLFVTTAGVGVVPDGLDLGPHRIRPGDAVLVSGPIGRHGIAVLSVREGLEFGVEVRSDCAPLTRPVQALLAAGVDVHMLRDPTRGGVAATLNELAGASRLGVEVTERDVPVPEPVRAACGFLGLDPLEVANEGCFVAVIGRDDADRAVEVLRGDELTAEAALIGEVVQEHPGLVVGRTGIGATRVIDLPLAEQLPRIC
ncbi:MAG: hydrogenase expression/formation protein HypE [Acidimicrobiales bacterium]